MNRNARQLDASSAGPERRATTRPCRLGRLATAAAALSLAACANVFSPTPVGEESVAIDPADWDGLWTEPNLALVIKTLDADRGVLDVFMVDGSTRQSVTVELRRSGGWLFGSFNDYDDEDAPGDGESPPDNGTPIRDARPYAWVRVVNKDNKLVFWQPHTDRFRRAVERGDLPGRVATEEDGDPVYLGRLEPEHYRLITESSAGVLMDWDEPVVLVRSAR